MFSNCCSCFITLQLNTLGGRGYLPSFTYRGNTHRKWFVAMWRPGNVREIQQLVLITGDIAAGNVKWAGAELNCGVNQLSGDAIEATTNGSETIPLTDRWVPQNVYCKETMSTILVPTSKWKSSSSLQAPTTPLHFWFVILVKWLASHVFFF